MIYNFDPRNHNAYTRVKGISISYGPDRIPSVSFVIQQAVIDGGGRVRHTDATPIEKGPVSALSLPPSVPVVNEFTGDLTESTVTLASLQSALASYARWILDQENKPAEQDSGPSAENA
jgi:hypothetical protein